MRRTALLLLTAAAPSLFAQSKPTLTPKDYGKFERLDASRLSPDGRWLAYGVSRVSEENELRLRPIARDTTIVVAMATNPVFTGDSKFLAYTIELPVATREKLERDKKPVRAGAGWRNLATNATGSLTEVSSLGFSADGRFLALRRFPAEGKHAADLVVLDLVNDTRFTMGNVSEFAWADVRALLAVAVETEGGAGNATQLYDATTGSLRALDASASLYRALSWRKKSDDLAVLRTEADKSFRDTTHSVLAWTHAASGGTTKRELLVSAAKTPAGLRVAEHKKPEWSDDGSALYIGLRPRLARRDSTLASGGGDGGVMRADSTRAPDKKSDVQVWHAKDVRIMPMQKVQEQRELQSTLLAVWHVGDGSVVQLGTNLLETTRVLHGGRFAIETDRAPYAFGTMFGRPFEDVYVIDTKTGARHKALEKVRWSFGPSALGTKLLSFDGKDFWTTDVATGARANISSSAKADFSDRDFDMPHDIGVPLGVAGWTSDEKAVLAYDRFDVWRLPIDGTAPKRLTDGASEHVVHRYAKTRLDDDGIDATKPIYLSLFDDRTKKSGFASLAPKSNAVTRLVLEDARVMRLARADSTDTYAFTRERFDDSPDWFVGGSTLGDAKQVSATNPFQKEFAWGKTELVNFTSAAGVPLQGILFYPANHDASKKYPMIVYTYERLSQGLHNYVLPSERNYYDAAVFTQEGYFVLMPDIVFRDREPGPSVLDAVVPAVHAIVARGLVDSTKIGHVGHSWGGYEATFLPTRTHIFAASVAGAPITNFLSFAGAIHWTPGIAEFDHWETGQARMGVPYWEDMDSYLKSSPAAKVNELKTPLLMEVGDADGTVDWHQGIEFYNFARRAGREDFVLLVYPGEDHGLRKKENQIDYHRRILQWYGHYLKGEPAAPWMTNGVSWLDRKETLEQKP